MGLPSVGSSNRQRISRTRRPHPVTLLIFMMVWTVAVFSLQGIALQGIMLGSILAFFAYSQRGRSNVVTFFRLSVPFILLYTLVGAVFSDPSSVVFWRGPTIPMLGTLAMSWTGIESNLVRAVRTWNLLALMFTFGGMIQPSDIVYWLRRPFARVALTISMILNFIPSLITERNRIVELSKTRGATSGGALRRDRIRAVATVYQTLLHNALERSWLLAESMYIRGYGAANRTFYRPPRWRSLDVLSFVLMMLCFAFLAIGHGVLTKIPSMTVMVRGMEWLCVALLIVMLFQIGGRLRVPH